MTDATQSPETQPAQITTLADVVRVLGDGEMRVADNVTAYRSFHVQYRDDHSCTVQIGFWNPITKSFTPDRQLVLREDALRLLTQQLQSQLDRITKHETWAQYIKRVLTVRGG